MTSPAEQQSQDEQMHCPTCGREMIVSSWIAEGRKSYALACPRGHHTGPLADSPAAAIASDRAARTQGGK